MDFGADSDFASVFRRNFRIIFFGLLIVIKLQKLIGWDSFEHLMGEHMLLIPVVITPLWNWLHDRSMDGWATAEVISSHVSFFLLVLFIIAQHAVEWAALPYNLGEYAILIVLILHTVFGVLNVLIQTDQLSLTPTSKTVAAWTSGLILGALVFVSVEYLTKGLILPLASGIIVTLITVGIVTLMLSLFSRSKKKNDSK